VEVEAGRRVVSVEERETLLTSDDVTEGIAGSLLPSSATRLRDWVIATGMTIAMMLTKTMGRAITQAFLYHGIVTTVVGFSSELLRRC
jgi:hypothetical protein